MRKHNPRLVKIHRNYTVEEIAILFGIHKNTVHQWIKRGLPVMDNKRPKLIHGEELLGFIKECRTKNKKSCKPGEIYCVKCREPRSPLNLEVCYRPITEKLGDLVGICPCCEIAIYRRASMAKLQCIRGELSIMMPKGLEHLVET